jgi:hypothetical protein
VEVLQGSLLLQVGRERKRRGGALMLDSVVVRVHDRGRRILAVVGILVVVVPWNIERTELGRRWPSTDEHDIEMGVVAVEVVVEEQLAGDLVVGAGISMEEPWRAVVVVGIHWMIVAVLDVQVEESELIVQEQTKTVVEVEQMAGQGYFSSSLMEGVVDAELGVEEHHLGYLSNGLVLGPQTLGWEEDDQVQALGEQSHWHCLRRLLRGD